MYRILVDTIHTYITFIVACNYDTTVQTLLLYLVHNNNQKPPVSFHGFLLEISIDINGEGKLISLTVHLTHDG